MDAKNLLDSLHDCAGPSDSVKYKLCSWAYPDVPCPYILYGYINNTPSFYICIVNVKSGLLITKFLNGASDWILGACKGESYWKVSELMGLEEIISSNPDLIFNENYQISKVHKHTIESE